MVTSLVFIGFYFPGTSYLFIWPILFSMLHLTLSFSFKKILTPLRFLLLAVTGLPVLLILLPTQYFLLLAFATELRISIVAIGALVCSSLWLLLPQLEFTAAIGRQWVVLLCILAGFAFLYSAWS